LQKEGIYRLRIGNYRAIYRIAFENKEVFVYEIFKVLFGPKKLIYLNIETFYQMRRLLLPKYLRMRNFLVFIKGLINFQQEF
jgi:hypothetical protein